MIIAFYGTSGSGKSTLLKKVVKQSYFKNKKIDIHREDNFLLLNIAKRLFGKKLFSGYNSNRMSGKSDKSSKNDLFSILVLFLYPLAIYFEFISLYIFYKILFKDRILFCDRYIYDYIITFKNNLKINNKIITSLFNNFPRPDLLFFLDIDPKTSWERNKSSSKFPLTATSSFHKKVIADYRLLAEEKKMLIIDTAKDVKNSLMNVENHINNRQKLLLYREIIISGLDGVGKSTTCNLINAYCESLNVSSKIVHFYYDNSLFKILKKLKIMKRRKIDKELQKKRRAMNRERKERHHAVNLFFALLHFIDSYMQYLFFRILHLKSVIIFDRYFYDYIVSFKYHGVKYLSIFEKIIPAVNNSFLIINDPNIAYGRKPEIAKDFYQLGDKEYVRLAIRKKIKIINANKKLPQQVVSEILNNLKI